MAAKLVEYGVGAAPKNAAPEYMLDLADEVDRRRKRFAAFFPLGRANLTGMLAHVDRCFDLADEFNRIAANAFTSDFHDLDDAVWVDYEGRTVGKALAFAQYAEIVADDVVLVAKHVVVDLANRWRAVMP
jgi:hypothetical protein